MYDSPECQKADSWIKLLKQNDIVKLTDFLNRQKSYARLSAAMENQTQIKGKISSLSNLEKENVREYLRFKTNEIDSNILSKLSKLISNDEIPSFVYFIVGSIIAYCLIDIVSLPFWVIFIVSSVLISSLMFLFLSNNKNLYCHNYLLKLLD